MPYLSWNDTSAQKRGALTPPLLTGEVSLENLCLINRPAFMCFTAAVEEVLGLRKGSICNFFMF